jgi:hypothetical protein
MIAPVRRAATIESEVHVAKKATKKPSKAVKPRKASVAMTGSLSANFHEGSRSEYLAQFVFSSFGTAIPVPRQEDTGLDIYCTLLEQVGQRAWPRAYYSVQVKSTLGEWVFDGPESVRWIIEHPLPSRPWGGIRDGKFVLVERYGKKRKLGTYRSGRHTTAQDRAAE